MKKRKLNWNNLFVLIVFAWSIGVIIFDFLTFTISMFLGHMAAYTWCGFISYGLCWVMLGWSMEEIKEILDKKREKTTRK